MTLIYLYKWNYIGYGKNGINLKIFVHDFWKKQLIEEKVAYQKLIYID